MILILHGPDDYRREEKKRFILEEFLKKHPGTNREVFDFSVPASREDFFVFARSSSLFDPMKLAVITDIADAPLAEAKKLKTFAADPRCTILISQRGKLPKGDYGFLLTASQAQEFPLLDGAAWKAFAAASARDAGVSLSARSLSFLSSLYQGDAWRFVTEIEKLRDAKKIPLQPEDLAGYGLETTPDMWSTLMRFKKAPPLERFGILDILFHQNEPAAKIFNILSSLWIEKTPRFAEYDLAIKSGRLDYEEALVDLAMA